MFHLDTMGPLVRIFHTGRLPKGSKWSKIWELEEVLLISVTIQSHFVLMKVKDLKGNNNMGPFGPLVQNNGLNEMEWTEYHSEMDSLTPKTPDNICHTLCFMKKINVAKFITSFGDHLGFMSIKKVAQGCQSGNQARIVLEWPQNKNHQKKVHRKEHF